MKFMELFCSTYTHSAEQREASCAAITSGSLWFPVDDYTLCTSNTPRTIHLPKLCCSNRILNEAPGDRGGGGGGGVQASAGATMR